MKFNIGDDVVIVPLGVSARVIARCQHLYESDSYGVDYVGGDGQYKTAWFYGELLESPFSSGCKSKLN